LTAIPEPAQTITAMIDEAFAADRQDKPRAHLGASLLGHHCDRWLWLSFRWASKEDFSGRILRLFQRGQDEEARLISLLRRIGIDVRGTQERVDFGKHVSGSLDGIIYAGVPGALAKKHVVEFKTHSLKSFNDLEKKGVEESKPMHWAQMQVYMHGTKIDRALYVAVCKDDDRIYTERVRYDKEAAERLVARGHAITQADRMPPPISTDPSFYLCKFCPAYEQCHQAKPTRFANCRTCAHVTVRADDVHCGRWDASIPEDAQAEGCEDHVIHPDMVPWPMEGSEDGHSVTWTINGRQVVNGAGGYKSREILANPDACGGSFVESVRAAFPGAEVVG
jgi:hypothetical protein